MPERGLPALRIGGARYASRRFTPGCATKRWFLPTSISFVSIEGDERPGPFASHIARLRAHHHALGVAYTRARGVLAEFERLTVGWPDDVLSEALVRKSLAGRTEGGRPHRLTVMRALARFLVLEEPRTFVPPPRFLGIRRRPPAIRVLSREEAGRFLLARDALPETSAFPRGRIRGTALRVLLLTGLRRGELLSLTRC